MKKPTIASKVEKHWTVLLVDGQGRIRRIPHFRRKLWIIAGLSGGALLLALVMGILYSHTLIRQQTLSDELSLLEDKLVAMRQQNELLKARAVRLETMAADPEKGQGAASSLPVATNGEDAPADDSSAKTAPSASTSDPPPPSSAKPAESAVAEATETKPKPQVDAEKLTVAYRPETETIEAQFLIRNTGDVTAGGRAVVVMHTAEGASQVHLALPAVPMRNGRPVGDHGRRFSISRFMTLNVERKYAEPGTQFVGAVVYAFTLEGRLLLEKAFDVTLDIPAEEPPEEVPPVAAPLGLNLPDPETEKTTGDQP